VLTFGASTAVIVVAPRPESHLMRSAVVRLAGPSRLTVRHAASLGRHPGGKAHQLGPFLADDRLASFRGQPPSVPGPKF
jgi:hypothetical protein